MLGQLENLHYDYTYEPKKTIPGHQRPPGFYTAHTNKQGNQHDQKKTNNDLLPRLHELKDIPDLQIIHGIFESQVTKYIQQTIWVRI